MKKIHQFCFLAAILFSASANAGKFNILDYGASKDTSVLSTGAIQKAIDECSATGGGEVMIPSGTFKTGTIILKSNVILYLENGSVLYGSRDLKDYRSLKPAYVSLRTQEATVQLIYAENEVNIGITGYGTIDGQGSGFKKLSWNDEGITRPHLLRFIRCRGIWMKDITMKNSGCWMQHYLACEDIHMNRLHIFNRNNFNNDGIDIDGCRHVTISDVISDSDDDGITLKSTSPAPCENITITGCVISSRCNAIKMGTESNGGFKNIVISNCVVKPSTVEANGFYGQPGGTSGISLEIVDGGTMQGIVISNIQIDGTESPLFIRLGNRARSYSRDVEITKVGSLSDVLISHVQIKNAGKTGCSMTGLPGFPISAVRLSDISIEQSGGCLESEIQKEIPEKQKDYPEGTMFGILPAYGFYIRHATDITLDRVILSCKQYDARSAIVMDDVVNAELSGITIKTSQGIQPDIALHHIGNIWIHHNSVAGNTGKFVAVSGKDNPDVVVENNLLQKGKRVMEE